jgi:AcrR family transcriptional regulator
MTTRAAHRPSTRDAMLDAAERHLRDTGQLSLASAARAAGVTKAGLMYHFATKEDLMSAVMDHVIDRYERELSDVLAESGRAPDSGAFAQAGVEDRIRAYITWACCGDFDPSDLVMFADPRLQDVLAQRWSSRVEPLLVVPADLPAPRRARLLGARLMADGVWFDVASGLLPLTPRQRDDVRRVALDLVDGDRA